VAISSGIPLDSIYVLDKAPVDYEWQLGYLGKHALFCGSELVSVLDSGNQANPNLARTKARSCFNASKAWRAS